MCEAWVAVGNNKRIDVWKTKNSYQGSSGWNSCMFNRPIAFRTQPQGENLLAVAIGIYRLKLDGFRDSIFTARTKQNFFIFVRYTKNWADFLVLRGTKGARTKRTESRFNHASVSSALIIGSDGYGFSTFYFLSSRTRSRFAADGHFTKNCSSLEMETCRWFHIRLTLVDHSHWDITVFPPHSYTTAKLFGSFCTFHRSA